jgi:LPXTG-site transpeptidase (sortase) family protein
MNGIEATARLVRAVSNAWAQRWLFLVVFLVVFFFSFSALIAVDLVPNTTTSTPSVSLSASPLVAVAESPLSPNVFDAFAHGENPVKIEIPKTKLVAPIANPTTTNVNALDALLLKGAVRYPTSGLLGENGNVVLFGHSAEYYPIVNNPWYKTFDNIDKLKEGDEIIVYSSSRAYVYTVDTVEKKNASEDAIPLKVTGAKLTLSTCDTFGKKTDRWVVTATLVESHLIGA